MSDRPKKRVLSMDGGPGLVVYLRLLRELVLEQPDFFDHVDLYAGTSAGAICALYFAKHEKGSDGIAMIDGAIELADNLVNTAKAGFPGLMRFFSGVFSIDNTRQLRHLLESYLNIDGKNTRLGDLKRHVTLVSFMLRDPWRPKIYHNYNDDDDCHTKSVDVALCSSAFPIYYPIVNGHVDGGVFANNPAMCAVAQLLHQAHLDPSTCRIESNDDGAAHPGAHHCEIDDIVVLSLGGEDRRFGGALDQYSLEQDLAKWGWLQWLFQFPKVLLLLDLLINADGKGVSYQCEQILRQRFKRLALTAKVGNIGGFLELFFGRGEEFQRQASRLAEDWRNNPTSEKYGPNFDDMRSWLKNNWPQPEDHVQTTHHIGTLDEVNIPVHDA